MRVNCDISTVTSELKMEACKESAVRFEKTEMRG